MGTSPGYRPKRACHHYSSFMTNEGWILAVGNVGKDHAIKIDKTRMLMNTMELTSQDVADIWGYETPAEVYDTLAGNRSTQKIDDLYKLLLHEPIEEGRTIEVLDALLYRQRVLNELIKDFKKEAEK